MELRASSQPLPAEWCAQLGLSNDATYASAADTFLGTFVGRDGCAWGYDFPGKAEVPDPAVRECSPQPSDDSAFQP